MDNQEEIVKSLVEVTFPEKDDFLKRLLKSETRLDLKLKRHLDTFTNIAKSSITKIPLKAILHTRKEVINQANQATKIEAERKHRLKMERLIKEEEKHWKSVYENLDLKQGHAYDKATKLLIDLKNLAIFKDDLPIFESKFKNIVDQYGRSQALMRRFRTAKL